MHGRFLVFWMVTMSWAAAACGDSRRAEMTCDRESLARVEKLPGYSEAIGGQANADLAWRAWSVACFKFREDDLRCLERAKSMDDVQRCEGVSERMRAAIQRFDRRQVWTQGGEGEKAEAAQPRGAWYIQPAPPGGTAP